MRATASFDQQVAVKLDTYRDTFTTANEARAARDIIASATEGQEVTFTGSNFEGGGSSAMVVRDKLACEAALNQLIKELDAATAGSTTTTLKSRSLMVYPDYSSHDLQT